MQDSKVDMVELFVFYMFWLAVVLSSFVAILVAAVVAHKLL